jgi:hypothetical protein
VYRGSLATLLAQEEVRTSDVVPPFPPCRIFTDADQNRRPDTTDSTPLLPGQGFVYLVTARNLLGEGPLGPPGYGVNDGQCP